MQVYVDNIIIDPSVRSLCQKPYPNHPKGCPNYGKRAICPPRCPLITEEYDMSKGFWLVWIEFDFGAHCRKMRRLHPDWSQRQIECCLYWQGKANKKLREAVADVRYYLRGRDKWSVTYCPEAMGVNVTETMRRVGVELEWPPQRVVRKVALFGVKKDAAD